MARIMRGRVTIYKLMIIMATAAYQLFSFASNYQALTSIWGASREGQVWATMIAFGVVAIDFAGVKFLLGGLRSVFDGEPGVEWGWVTLGVCWLLTVGGDTWLSYFAIAQQMTFSSYHILIQSGVVSYETFTKGAPAFAAIMIGLIGILLAIRSEAIVGDSFEPARHNARAA